MSKTNYWDQIEQAFEDVDIYQTHDVFRQGASKHLECKIDLLAVHWTMSEVVNGGLEQYFSNSILPVEWRRCVTERPAGETPAAP